MTTPQTAPISIPRIAITFCTQCRWMLRAAYFAQELLSTFGTQIGEVALVPATGGLFLVELTYVPGGDEVAGEQGVKKVLLWDRKAEGGFPETKILKQRVRDHIDPKRDLGHSDRHGKKKNEEEKSEVQSEVQSEVKGERQNQGQEQEQKAVAGEGEVKRNPDGTICEDCR